MSNWIHNIFLRKGKREPKPLRIEGCKTVMTPEPDDAELAAQALLESMGEKKQKARKKEEPKVGTAEYYQELSRKIREGHAAEARAATRYVAYCEQELGITGMPADKLSELESGLYRCMNIIEREGGELKKRWQHCLAVITLMQDKKSMSETETSPQEV